MTLVLPNANVEVEEGGLGIVSTPAEDVCSFMGCTSKGVTLNPFAVATIARAKADYGAGPAVKSAAYSIGKTGAATVFSRLPKSARAAQKNDLVKPTGKGFTLAGTPNEGYDFSLVCTTAGTVGTGPGPSFKWSKDGGENYSAPASLGSGTTLVLTGTGGTATFTSGDSWSVGQEVTLWTVPASESVGPVTTTRANAGSPSTSTITVTGTPEDDYEVVWEQLVACTVGTTGGAYRYSLDGGRTWSPQTALGTENSVDLMDGDEASGLTVELGSGTLDALDRATCKAFGPSWSSADAITAIDRIVASTHSFRFFSFVGWQSATVIAAVAAKLGSIADGDEAKHTFGLFSARPRGTYEKESNWESRLLAEFASVADVRIGVGAGQARVTCAVTGRQDRRPILVPVVARIVSKTLQVDPGRRLDGPLGSDVQLYDDNRQPVEHDARNSPVLHGGRFITLRTYSDRAGVFVTRGNLMSAENSDFNRISNRAVMDLASGVFRSVMLEQIENHIATNPATGGEPGAIPGTIREIDARRIDRELTSALRVALVGPGYASDVQARVSRTDDFLSTGKLSAVVRIQPLGYVDRFDGKIGFINPKFAAFQVA